MMHPPAGRAVDDDCVIVQSAEHAARPSLSLRTGRIADGRTQCTCARRESEATRPPVRAAEHPSGHRCAQTCLSPSER